MKTILLLTTVAALASPAFAGKPRSTPSTFKSPVIGAIKKAPEPPLKMNFGESYVLGGRTSAQPTSAEPTHDASSSVSNSQFGKVVHERVEELEYCWLRLPASKREPTSATLHLAIEASGAVAGVSIDGVLPAGMSKCITAAASKWTFPSADSGCEIEHGISMGMKSDTVR